MGDNEGMVKLAMTMRNRLHSGKVLLSGPCIWVPYVAASQGLVVHRRGGVDSKAWAVTHVNSGLRIVQAATKRGAIGMMGRLGPIVPWAECTAQELQDIMTEDWLKQIRRIVGRNGTRNLSMDKKGQENA